MKDYKEMTESVLQQANARAAQRARQRRMATGLIAATLCFAILIAVVGFGVGRNPAGTTQPTISMENPTTVPTTQPETTEPIVPPEEMKIYFLSGNTDQLSQRYLLEGVSIPIGGQIRVRRLDGLSEEERQQAIREEHDIYDAYRAENYSEFLGGGGSIHQDRLSITSCMLNGSISLEFADKNHVASVDIVNSCENGLAGGSICYTETTTYGEGDNQVTFHAGSMRYIVFWSIPDNMRQKLIANPNMPFSEISDTITITVNYSNGAQQTLIIDVTVDDDGHIYMTQRGNGAGV